MRRCPRRCVVWSDVSSSAWRNDNPAYDRLDKFQLHDLDLERRRELLIEQTNIVNNELPIVILRFAVVRIVYNGRLDTIYPSDRSLLPNSPFVWVES